MDGGFKNGKIGHVFHHISTNRAHTAKRSPPSDSAHPIGLSTILKDVLTVEKGVYGWMFKNRKIGHVFHHISTHRARTSKQSSPSDSAHRIGLSARLNDVLTVEEGVCGWMFKNSKIGHVFHHISRTRARTAKWTTPSDSAHRIGALTLLNDVLTVEEVVCAWRFINCRILNVFNYRGRTRSPTAKRTSPSDSAH